MTMQRTVSMPEASALLSSSFPVNVREINDLGALREHEEYRGDEPLSCNKAPNSEPGETDDTVEDDYGFFPMDDDDDLQVGEPQSNNSLSISDRSSEDLDSSGRRTAGRKKSALKKGSAYGDGNEVIPLDFDRKEFNRVLPKPDLLRGAERASSHPDKKIIRSGSKGLFRVASEPVFVRPVYRPEDEADEVEASVHSLGASSMPSAGFVEGAMKKRISFGTIKIREHAQTIGDNPSCTYGTPVQLDWESQDLEELKVEDYEMYRPRIRKKEEFHLNSIKRANILKANGHSTNEIKKSKKDVSKVRNQRERTKFMVLNYPQLMTVGDAVESGLRKVKRSVSKSKLSDGDSISRKSSQDDLRVPSPGSSTAQLLEMMDNDVSNVTAPF